MCDKCGVELKTGLYVADSIVNYIEGFDKGSSIDLCETCNKSLISTIKLWWNSNNKCNVKRCPIRVNGKCNLWENGECKF